MNYYNEFDPLAAAWLRQLITDGAIPAGHVDDRSITEVTPNDLKGFNQCHFFAGIGGWSHAARLARWSECRLANAGEHNLWTASLPCQPFSVAGLGKGTADERHLWPVFRELASQCNPSVIFGEQVASKAGRDWLSGVFADLETMGYATAGADLCAAGAGAPHIRQRLFWGGVALPLSSGGWQRVSFAADCLGYDEETGELGDECSICGLDYTEDCECPGPTHDGYEYAFEPDGVLYARRVVHPGEPGLEGYSGDGDDIHQRGRVDAQQDRPVAPASPAGWDSYDIIPCRDGKTRRAEPGSFPLVDGVPRGVVPSGDPCSPEYSKATGEARVMRLKGYGNAIVPPLAAVFMEESVAAIVENF